MDGNMSTELVAEALALANDACAEIYEVQKKALKEGALQ